MNVLRTILIVLGALLSGCAAPLESADLWQELRDGGFEDAIQVFHAMRRF